ncbi:MAG: exosortase/archaeosortase family protein [candidate division Zixibacteria bacterium]|nr:exosortase/archaeosortase family protein [candidate division Zixibacteria bacterium]
MSDQSLNNTANNDAPSESTPAIPLWQILVLVAAFLILYLPILIDLVSDWYHDPNYGHGFLIIPVSAWLIWKKRAVLKTIPLETGKWGLPITIASLALFILGTAGAEFFTTRVSMVGLLFGITLYMAGPRFLREIWFAFFFLLFMIPVPYIIYYAATFPLQLLGSKIAAGVLGIIGIPHLRQGNIIHLPDNYSLEVAEACSGLRSLVTLLALGALLSYLTLKTKWKAMTLFLATIPIAIAANIFRITITAIGAYGISRKIAEDFMHELSGTIVFMFSLLCLLILSSILRVREK